MLLKILSKAFGTHTRSSKKVYQSSSQIIADIQNKNTLLVGGYGLCGLPDNLITALANHNAQDYTVVSNNVGTNKFGLGLLLRQRKIKRVICSHIGDNSVFAKQFLSGEIELEITPQGTLAEKLRAGGAGIPAFYTRTAVGTLIQEGGGPISYNEDGDIDICTDAKESEEFDGVEYLLEEAITGDFALIKAWKADTAGNLVFRKSARNFNPVMAKAAKITIAEVEHIVDVGNLQPDEIHLPGIFVDRIVVGEIYNKNVEYIKLNKPVAEHSVAKKYTAYQSYERIARRAALEFKDGMYVHLGRGIPVLAYSLLPENANIYVYSHNGILGASACPDSVDKIDKDLIDDNRETIMIRPGASFFSSDESFAIIRGGHIDLNILTAKEVSQYGDFANVINKRNRVRGVGGEMDVASALNARLVVCMEHTEHDGTPKILTNCTLPLIGQKCVDLIITDKGVFSVDPEEGLTLMELAEGVEIEEVFQGTACSFTVSESLKPMQQFQIK